MFIFAFFAINVVLESLTQILFKTTGSTFNSTAEQKAFEAAFCILGVLYLLSYLCYINILQAVWAYKHRTTYEDPILGCDVPVPVYIRNRQLIRHKQVMSVKKPSDRFFSCAELEEEIPMVLRDNKSI
jgi:hypothetical protein